MTSAALDRRRSPLRADLAAAHLRGVVDAPRYVEGAPHRVAVGRAPLRPAPDQTRPLDSEVVFGEGFTVYDAAADGWVWGQSAADDYVGWLRADALRPVAGPLAPTHLVTARHSFLFSAPDIKSPVLDVLPLGARLTVAGEQGRFLELTDEMGAAGTGFVFAGHAAPLGWRVDDPLCIAESLLGVPYLWGGRTPLGIDCSGLVQLCLACAGVAAPRDSDMQRAELGDAVDTVNDPPRRGDVVCFPGHVALMWDDRRVIHATAFTLSVCIEPLADVALRADPTRGQGILAVRRVGLPAARG